MNNETMNNETPRLQLTVLVHHRRVVYHRRGDAVRHCQRCAGGGVLLAAEEELELVALNPIFNG